MSIVRFGVPQGSFLGPALFIMCTNPLSTVSQRDGVKHHLYADDTQLYVSLDPRNMADVSSALEYLENYIADIQLWMTSNVLKLN